MRLLNIKTLQLEQFHSKPPPYVILSHTWSDQEVTLQELGQASTGQKRGYQKISQFCKIVSLRIPDVKYVWVDTCCIDKTSSAELTEAINSMFQWYRNAESCFAYLEDVERNSDKETGEDFETSKWFTRGWTLQELLAPRDVEFFDRKWDFIGCKETLRSRISKATRIQEEALRMQTFHSFSVACRISWMSGRQTTRLEDMAYSLLGLFDISMPMLYGEGDKAFIRLQEEIIREYDDQSIFAWDSTDIPLSVDKIGVLATHPSMFRDGVNLEARPSIGEPLVITNRGIRMSLPILMEAELPDSPLGILSCSKEGIYSSVIGIRLDKSKEDDTKYGRKRSAVVSLPMKPFALHGIMAQASTVTLVKRSLEGVKNNLVSQCWVQYPTSDSFPPCACKVIAMYPSAQWKCDDVTKTLTWTFRGTTEEVVESTIVFIVEDTGERCAIRIQLRPSDGLGQVGMALIASDLNISDENAVLSAVNDSALDNGSKGDRMIQLTRVCLVARLTATLMRGQWASNLEIFQHRSSRPVANSVREFSA